jgi:hypothetical protein
LSRTDKRSHGFPNLRRARNSGSVGHAGKHSTISRIPLLEYDRARVAIIEPSRVITYTRAVCALPRRILKSETAWRGEVHSNCRYRSVSSQTTSSG